MKENALVKSELGTVRNVVRAGDGAPLKHVTKSVPVDMASGDGVQVGGKGAPIVSRDGPWVDPLPQALILTAIVIGFGVVAYLVLLLYRTFLDQHTANAHDLFRPGRVRPEPRKEEGS